jgi:GH25 family lysozyme M1 (1,4-beta-N-acetylmuramidase)
VSVRTRWLAKLNVARLWATIARRRYMWKPSEKNRAELERRRRQVEYALRVLKRHPHDEPVPAKGLDVSNLQGHIDWAKVQQAGYRFVWIKAGEGDWHDPNFLVNVRMARANGLDVGAYQFLRPKASRTGAHEAEYFIARLKEAGLGRGDLRPVLDVEATERDREGTRTYVGSFVAEMRRAGFRPKPWTKYAAWQYTSKGSVPGIHGNVDLNQTSDLRQLIA